MSADGGSAGGADRIGESKQERRRRLAAVFGDPLPDTTGDERDPVKDTESAVDRWYQEQVPPHHG